MQGSSPIRVTNWAPIPSLPCSELENPDEVISAHQLEWSQGEAVADSPVDSAPASAEPKVEPQDYPVEMDSESGSSAAAASISANASAPSPAPAPPPPTSKHDSNNKDVVDADLGDVGGFLRSKLPGSRLALAQVLEDGFRKEIVGFHPLTRTPCYPVIVQHRRFGSFITFVPSKDMPATLSSFSSVTTDGSYFFFPDSI